MGIRTTHVGSLVRPDELIAYFVSDGEYRKSAWNHYVYERLSGIELRPHPVEHADFADAYIPFMYDVIVPPGTMEDHRAWAQPRIDALNHALEGIPADCVRYHVCWGSWNGPHTNDIALRDILDLVFKVNAGTYLYENANPRHARTARLVGPENVLGSTDCGFAHGPYIQRVHESIKWAKLSALAEGAKLACGALV